VTWNCSTYWPGDSDRLEKNKSFFRHLGVDEFPIQAEHLSGARLCEKVPVFGRFACKRNFRDLVCRLIVRHAPFAVLILDVSRALGRLPARLIRWGLGGNTRRKGCPEDLCDLKVVRRIHFGRIVEMMPGGVRHFIVNALGYEIAPFFLLRLGEVVNKAWRIKIGQQHS
jgi:hypothetical protein